MNWISFILSSLSLFIVGTMIRPDVDILSPGRTFGSRWSLVFALANLKPSGLHFDWTPTIHSVTSRLIGFLHCCSFGGLVVGFVYYTLRPKPTIGILSLYCIFVYVMALSFFLNPLGFLWLICVITWIFASVRYVSIRPGLPLVICGSLAFRIDRCRLS